jgi:hypothetical protein
MLNQVAPGPTPFNRVHRRPSLGRIFFWSYILGIPLVAVSAGIIMLIASSRLDAAVQIYRSAGLCPAASTSDTCFTLVPGTLVSFNINRGKTGDTAYMTIQLPTRTASTWAMTSWAQEDALHVGVPLRAKLYQGMISAIYVGDTGIETKDSPMYKQGNLRQGAIFVPIIGLALGAGSYWALRRRSPSMPVPITMIDNTLPIADQPEARPVAVNLPLTLHPRPIPTSYPWWLSLIAAGIGIPSLVLRMRTPAAIAQVVIAATALAMLAAIILHWLYRHRRTLVVDHISVRRVNLFGVSREIPRAEVAGLALRTISSSNARVPDEPRLLILDATGRCLLRLTRYYPTEGDIAQLAAALGVPLPPDAGRFASASRLRRTIPGAASWVEAHPYLTSLVLLPPILAAIVLFVFALNGLK